MIRASLELEDLNSLKLKSSLLTQGLSTNSNYSYRSIAFTVCQENKRG